MNFFSDPYFEILSKGSSKNENPVWITGADALMDSLKIHGVKVIFGYPGGTILPIYDAVHKADKMVG